MIDAAKNTPITDQQMTRITTSLLSELTFAQDSITAQAQIIGELANMGLPVDSYDRLPEDLKQIHPAKVQEVAKHYLTKDNLTTLYILPKDNDSDDQSTQ